MLMLSQPIVFSHRPEAKTASKSLNPNP